MGWTQLRPLQVRAIQQIMWSEVPVVLAAATASGKTEAAFLPILSRIADQPHGAVRVIYIGPLKALINDQFARIEELCGYREVPVFRWHGDVSISHKEKLVKSPGGVLLITPESLESLFVNRSQYLLALFGGLRFIVIDELHSFLDNERGLHLRSLLSRVAPLVQTPGGARPVALSATIGDFSVARRFVSPDQPDRVALIDDRAADKEIKLRIHGYRAKVAAEEDENPDKPPEAMYRTARDIVKHCSGAANLVFTNARGDVEEYADLCNRIAQEQRLADRFLVHHGSLSAEIRQETEYTMKQGIAATTLCSSTLEMGIDLGSVKMVSQVGAPWSAASLKQRLGRSGRKAGQPQILRTYIHCRSDGFEADLFGRLNLDLLQAVAVTELMLEGWVEPSQPPQRDLSTLVQQIISMIAQTGGIRADLLYDRLCGRGAFGGVDRAIFARLLRQLAAQDVIEQMDAGDLILGLLGERLRKDKGFYAVFPTPEEYAVLHQGVVLGKLECAHQKGDHLLFAGRRWKVIDVDDERLQMHVEPARGWKRPRFGGGVGKIHPAIRQKMRQVLSSASRLAYLDPEAQSLLDEARRAAASAGVLSKDCIALGPRRTAWFTWTGSQIQQTLSAMFKCTKVDAADELVALCFELDEQALAAALANCLHADLAPEQIAANLSVRQRRKYDAYLGDALLNWSLAGDAADLRGARELLGRAVGGQGPGQHAT